VWFAIRSHVVLRCAVLTVLLTLKTQITACAVHVRHACCALVCVVAETHTVLTHDAEWRQCQLINAGQRDSPICAAMCLVVLIVTEG
jgi:hypothetical protein